MTVRINRVGLLIAEAECAEQIDRYEPKPGYCNVTWDKILCWEQAPTGTIVKQACPSYVLDIRTTGFAYRECGYDAEWIHPDPGTNQTRGWTNYSECFSEDPVFADIKYDLTRIELMSNIGYGISLVSLVVAILIMIISKGCRCKSNNLHINLFAAFVLRAVVSLLKDVLFVEGLGLEKDVTWLTPEKVIFIEDNGMHWECKMIVVLLMYSVAASMMWIFMEGLYLHMLVNKTLFTERNGIRLYVIFGWLSPALYVTAWTIIRVNFDNTLCWNTDAHSFVWIIKTPIIVTILVNFVFFINIIRALCNRMKIRRSFTSQSIRKLAKFSLVLIPLFGVQYIATSAYPVGVNIRADMIYLYCEMFYNSFQGFLLAVLFCFLNEEVHSEIHRCWYHRRHHERVYTRTFTVSSLKRSSYVSNSISGRPSMAQKQERPTQQPVRNSICTICAFVTEARKQNPVTEPMAEECYHYEGAQDDNFIQMTELDIH